MNIEWLLIIAMVGAYVWHKRKPKQKPNKFYVDERAACVVVRHKVSRVITDYPDVNPKLEVVVAYWEGTQYICPGHVGVVYNVEDWKVRKTHELCNLLNKGG